MVNFTSIIQILANDVKNMMEQIGYTPHIYKSMQKSGRHKYTIRLSKDVQNFIQEINLSKK